MLRIGLTLTEIVLGFGGGYHAILVLIVLVLLVAERQVETLLRLLVNARLKAVFVQVRPTSRLQLIHI